VDISSYQVSSLIAILPEIGLLVLAGTVLIMDTVVRDDRKHLMGVTTALGSVLIIVLALFYARPTGESIWGGMIRDDMLAFVLRLSFIFAGGVTAIFSLNYKSVAHRGDYYAIMLGAVIGMCFMASASDLILLYLAVETTGIAGYLLAGYASSNDNSAEAGLKYFLFGAATSGIMLYGFSILYGLTGETNFVNIAEVLLSGDVALSAVLGIAMLVLVGIGFKIAIVPFHFWAPDVYEGSPTPVTGFISTASKTAGFAILIRFFIVGFTGSEYWLPIVAVLAVITMTFGNLVALAQTNIKRLLAYSSIAHAGYVLIAFVAYSDLGVASAVFYLITYVVTNLAAFGVVILVSNTVSSDNISEYAGMSRRSPFLGLVMLVSFLSLAGMPPLAGFFAKFYVFAAIVKSDMIWLAFVGVLNAIIGLYYYLVVLKVVYVSPAPDGSRPIEISNISKIVLMILSFGIILIGTASSPWFDWAYQAAIELF